MISPCYRPHATDSMLLKNQTSVLASYTMQSAYLEVAKMIEGDAFWFLITWTHFYLCRILQVTGHTVAWQSFEVIIYAQLACRPI